jgi:hypothetical protein
MQFRGQCRQFRWQRGVLTVGRRVRLLRRVRVISGQFSERWIRLRVGIR